MIPEGNQGADLHGDRQRSHRHSLDRLNAINDPPPQKKKDKGPQRQWLWEIGKTDEPACVCGGWTAQNTAINESQKKNAAHLQLCPG